MILDRLMQTTLDTAGDICGGLREAFPATHLHYWILPVVEAAYLEITAANEKPRSD